MVVVVAVRKMQNDKRLVDAAVHYNREWTVRLKLWTAALSARVPFACSSAAMAGKADMVVTGGGNVGDGGLEEPDALAMGVGEQKAREIRLVDDASDRSASITAWYERSCVEQQSCDAEGCWRYGASPGLVCALGLDVDFVLCAADQQQIPQTK